MDLNLNLKSSSLHHHQNQLKSMTSPISSQAHQFSRSYGSSAHIKDTGSSSAVPVNLMVICSTFTSYPEITSKMINCDSIVPRAILERSGSLPPLSRRYDTPKLTKSTGSFDHMDYNKPNTNKHKQKYFSKLDEKIPPCVSVSFQMPDKSADTKLDSTKEEIVVKISDMDKSKNDSEDSQKKPNSRFLGKNRKKKEKNKMKKAEDGETNSIVRCENKLESIKKMLARKHLTDTEDESTNIDFTRNSNGLNNHKISKSEIKPSNVATVNNHNETMCGNADTNAVISNCNSVNSKLSCINGSVNVQQPACQKEDLKNSSQSSIVDCSNIVFQAETLKETSAERKALIAMSNQDCKETFQSSTKSNSLNSKKNIGTNETLKQANSIPIQESTCNDSSENSVKDINIIVPEKSKTYNILNRKIDSDSEVSEKIDSVHEKSTENKMEMKNEELKINCQDLCLTPNTSTEISPINQTLMKCESGIKYMKDLLKCKKKPNKKTKEISSIEPPVKNPDFTNHSTSSSIPISKNIKDDSMNMISSSESSGCGLSDDEFIIFSNTMNSSLSEDMSADENDEHLGVSRQISECDSEDSFICFVDSPSDTDEYLTDIVYHTDEISEDEKDEETLIKCDESEEADSDYSSCERASVEDVPKLKGCLKKTGLREASPRMKISPENDTKKVSFSPNPPKVHKIIAWKHAYHMARIGHWQNYSRDAERFKQRIANTSLSLDWVLKKEHRKVIFFQRFRPIIMRQKREEAEAKKREKEREIQEAKEREEELARQKENESHIDSTETDPDTPNEILEIDEEVSENVDSNLKDILVNNHTKNESLKPIINTNAKSPNPINESSNNT